ncbi:hypothetical protein [Deinococcus sedimenti]|uniref:Uncharacterized protein n=1 Tax=Deinococcus sedimenti TaxID=1867090 RepID=A0ABQ2S992_9DEIO|nr:hypothetical protein [Deinococcus sedimenti]GGS02670.1 hypothetical protein GCM10008960_31600 [Deinococcus sedimenti]
MAGNRIWYCHTRRLPGLNTRLVLSLTDRLTARAPNRRRDPFLQFGQLRGIGQIVVIHPTTLTCHAHARCRT